MAGIFSKVSAFARSPEGRKLLKQAQEAAKDPANRARVQELGNKVKARAAALSSEYKAGARGGEQAAAGTPAAGTAAPETTAPETTAPETTAKPGPRASEVPPPSEVRPSDLKPPAPVPPPKPQTPSSEL
jgi:hypothetical protein